jgi:hypothetical protein
MLDTCTAFNCEDFRQRYQNTVGWYVKETGEKQIVIIDKVGNDQVSFVTEEGTSAAAMNGTGVTFEFTQVPLGWYNTHIGPVFVSRRPARQWQRGISSKNTDLMDWTERRVPFDLKVIKALFEDDGEFKGLSYAPSKFFCLSTESLYFLNQKIGYLDKNVIFVAPTCSVVQELKDALARRNLPFTVEFT